MTPMSLITLAIIVMAIPMAASAANIDKSNNNISIDQSGSWNGGAAPGQNDIATWDSTVATAANCTNSLAAAVNWGGIQISNPIAAVKIVTNGLPAGAGISIGSFGITVTDTANLWLSPALTTTADQSWTIAGGLTLELGEANYPTAVNNQVTIAGNVLFPDTISVNSGGSLTIATGSSLASTVTNNAVTSIVVNGMINQTGGTVTIGRSDSSSGSPKATLSIGAGAIGAYNISGGSLIDASTTDDGRVDLGTTTTSSGTLNMSGGANLQLQALYIANGGNGTVNITNGSLTVAGNFRVGVSAGTGTMNVFGGIIQSASTMNVPNGPGTGFFNLNGGTVNVSAINAANSSGGGGPGTITINAGNLTVTNNIALAPSTGSATLNLDGGSTVVSSITHAGSGTATLNWNGGLLVARATTANFIAGNIPVNIGTNGAWIDTAGYNLTIPAVLAGNNADGGLIKEGAGTLTLTASNTYNGATIVSNGTLFVDNYIGDGAGTGNVIVENGATLGGTGTVAGNVVVDQGGILLSGLTVDGSVTFAGTSQSRPSFSSTILAQTNFVLAGGGGPTNGVYFVLSSTNIALPFSDWTMIGNSNFFDSNGNFRFTNSLNALRPSQYFAISLSPLILSPANSDILLALQNMRDEGFNSYLPTSGGLYINWIFTNTPPVSTNNVNVEYNGVADSSPTDRHDRDTDIVYLADLVLYRQLNPLDSQFDFQINQYTNICFSANDDNFVGDPDQRGWVYWVLQEIASGIPTLSVAANAQADKYYNIYTNNLLKFDGQVTPLYIDWNTNDAPGMHGTYTVNLVVEDACVLIVNGQSRGLTNYIAAGEALLNFAQSNAYSSALNIWADTMGNLFTTTNHTAATLSPPAQQVIYDNSEDASEIGEMTEALCRAEAADPGKGYGPLALATLNKLDPQTNSFGLWDDTYGGYFAALILNGTNIQSQTLTASVNNSYKEVGRAAIIIRSFIFANEFAGADYDVGVMAALNTANLNSYFAAGHGWVYQTNPDYSLYLDKGSGYSVLQNWVTSESTSHAVRALLTYELPVPQ